VRALGVVRETLLSGTSPNSRRASRRRNQSASRRGNRGSPGRGRSGDSCVWRMDVRLAPCSRSRAVIVARL
jgi:hypothetical protein